MWSSCVRRLLHARPYEISPCEWRKLTPAAIPIADIIALCLISGTRSSLYGAGKCLTESWVDPLFGFNEAWSDAVGAGSSPT